MRCIRPGCLHVRSIIILVLCFLLFTPTVFSSPEQHDSIAAGSWSRHESSRAFSFLAQGLQEFRVLIRQAGFKTELFWKLLKTSTNPYLRSMQPLMGNGNIDSAKMQLTLAGYPFSIDIGPDNHAGVNGDGISSLMPNRPRIINPALLGSWRLSPIEYGEYASSHSATVSEFLAWRALISRPQLANIYWRFKQREHAYYVDILADWMLLHTIRVQIFAHVIGVQMGLSEKDLALLTIAAGWHDLGKMDVPPSVLNKAGKLSDDERLMIQNHVEFSVRHLERNLQGLYLPKNGFARSVDDIRLTPEELRQYQAHPTRSADMIKKAIQDTSREPLYHLVGHDDLTVQDIKKMLHVMGAHHERLDGQGYPNKLKANQLSLLARILAFADVWEAVTGERPYKDQRDPLKGLRLLFEEDVYRQRGAPALDPNVYRATEAVWPYLVNYLFPDYIDSIPSEVPALAPRVWDALVQSQIINPEQPFGRRSNEIKITHLLIHETAQKLVELENRHGDGVHTETIIASPEALPAPTAVSTPPSLSTSARLKSTQPPADAVVARTIAPLLPRSIVYAANASQMPRIPGTWYVQLLDTEAPNAVFDDFNRHLQIPRNAWRDPSTGEVKLDSVVDIAGLYGLSLAFFFANGLTVDNEVEGVQVVEAGALIQDVQAFLNDAVQAQRIKENQLHTLEAIVAAFLENQA